MAPAWSSSSPQKNTTTDDKYSPRKIGSAMPQVRPSASAAAVRLKYEPSKPCSTTGAPSSQARPGRPSPRPKHISRLTRAICDPAPYQPPPSSSVARSRLGSQNSAALMNVFIWAPYGLRPVPPRGNSAPPAASCRGLLDMTLPGVQKVQHGLAALHVVAVFGQGHAFARARQIDAQDFADGRGRAVGHHHDAV